MVSTAEREGLPKRADGASLPRHWYCFTAHLSSPFNASPSSPSNIIILCPSPSPARLQHIFIQKQALQETGYSKASFYFRLHSDPDTGTDFPPDSREGPPLCAPFAKYVRIWGSLLASFFPSRGMVCTFFSSPTARLPVVTESISNSICV